MKVFGYSVTGSKRAILDVMNISDKGYELVHIPCHLYS